MALAIQAATGQHIGDKQEQQDRLAIFSSKRRDGMLLAVVADGMSGLSGGAVAAERAIGAAKRVFDRHSPGRRTPDPLLRSVIEEAHAAIRLARSTSEQEPHSTIVALLLQPGRADWVHSGDSRLYHFRGAKFLSHTVDHSYVEQLYREGKIRSGDRHGHPQRSLLVSCLGARDAPQIGIGGAAPLHPGDTFLLCSDGLWGYFDEQELGRTLAAGTPQQSAEKLVAAARVRARGRGDNLSLVIVKLG
ncbi:MAG: protein phosphatase 2C domain-containing protein [Burkholderiales bacterium]